MLEIFRDFMKWCHRISKDLGSGQKLTPDFVFEEAFDCFCLCLPLSSSRLTVAKAISEKIGIDASRVGAFKCLIFGFSLKFYLIKMN